MNKSSKSVFIIILTWNHLEDTIECLDSVHKSDYSNYHIVVVDNASTDSSVEYIKKNYPQVTIIQNLQNLGYAEGNNVGMRYALDQGAEYIFILNNDTVIQPDTVRLLVEDLEGNPQAIAAAPISYYYAQPEKIYFAGGFITPKGKVGHFTSIREKIGNKIDWLNGCALMIKANLISKVGLFDTDYFLIFEDTDWSFRARQSGYELLVVPKTRILHKASVSFNGSKSLDLLYYYTRNYHLWCRKNFPLHQRITFHITRFIKDFRTVKNTIKILLAYTPYHMVIRQGYIDYCFHRFNRRNYLW